MKTLQIKSDISKVKAKGSELENLDSKLKDMANAELSDPSL